MRAVIKNYVISRHFRKNKDLTPSDAADNCYNVMNNKHENITELQETMFKPIDDQIEICRETQKVKGYVKKWVDKNLKGLDTKQSMRELHKYMDETFPFMTYVAVAYPPYYGGNNHWTNADINKFR